MHLLTSVFSERVIDPQLDGFIWETALWYEGPATLEKIEFNFPIGKHLARHVAFYFDTVKEVYIIEVEVYVTGEQKR